MIKYEIGADLAAVGYRLIILNPPLTPVANNGNNIRLQTP
jgi:hypothetical protein